MKRRWTDGTENYCVRNNISDGSSESLRFLYRSPLYAVTATSADWRRARIRPNQTRLRPTETDLRPLNFESRWLSRVWWPTRQSTHNRSFRRRGLSSEPMLSRERWRWEQTGDELWSRWSRWLEYCCCCWSPSRSTTTSHYYWVDLSIHRNR